MTTTGPTGKIRNPWAVIGLSVITLGIYALYWQYASFKELKDYSGKGIGGALGLVFAFFIFIVNAFLMPSEVGDLYTVDGQQPPISALTGLWILLPIVGIFVWVIQTQGRLNEFWESKAAPVAAAAPAATPAEEAAPVEEAPAAPSDEAAPEADSAG